MRGLVTAAALLAAAACATSRPSAKPSSLVGKPVSVKAPDLEGRDHDVRADDGKVRVVDFWATWCDPCRDQLPFLDRMSAKYRERGLAVYGVSFDEDRGALEKYLGEMHPSFTVLWDKGGEVLADPLEVTRLPTTLFVDRKGVVREVHLGFEKSEEKGLESLLERLLAEP
jgi:cytochrome c biogenesis protein CcmG, thiol:disulfide interchange protein DsbE